MNEENNSGAGLRIIESEVELGERRIVGGNNLIKKINPVAMNDITPNERDILEGEVLILRRDNQLSSNLESPMGSFLSSIVNKVVKGKKMTLSPPGQIEKRS